MTRESETETETETYADEYVSLGVFGVLASAVGIAFSWYIISLNEPFSPVGYIGVGFGVLFAFVHLLILVTSPLLADAMAAAAADADEETGGEL